MAVKKAAAAKRGKGKKKTPARAPGKADPKFLSRLSRAVQEEFASAASGTASPARDEEPPKAPRPEARASRKTQAAAPEKKGAKPAARKSSGNRGPELLKELKTLLSELDEEGLEFLLEQAHVHRYNMEVERLNDAVERISVRKTVRGSGKTAPDAKAAPRVPALRIERSQDGNTYHIVSGGRYKMFSAEEMLSLVRIAHANPNGVEAGRGLHRWMARERMDAISDLGISGPEDPGLAALAGLLRKSFAKPAPRG